MAMTAPKSRAQRTPTAAASTAAHSADSGASTYLRLHVTPLDGELVKVVLSSALFPKARNISYHTLETFPEKRYGFLELPADDADKLRKKLNGAVLKGVKIRIEPARPTVIPEPLGDAAMAPEKDASKKEKRRDKDKSKDKSKKRKRGVDDELTGVVLEEGRQVKRGWTAPDEAREKWSKKDKKDKTKSSKEGKKKRVKSKYTDHAECLVKTVLPPNAVAPAADGEGSKKKKKGKSREVVIHEFERTTKFPTFLKAAAPSESSRADLEYEEGKGWVDADGNVVEAVKVRPPPPAKVRISSSKKEKRRAESEEGESEEDELQQHKENEEDQSGSSSESEGADSSVSDSEVESSSPVAETRTPSKLNGTHAPTEQPTSSTPSSIPVPSSSPSKSEPSRPKSSGSTRNLAIKIPPTTPSEPKVIHPLEALYKRNKQDGDATGATPEAQPFSFFGSGEGNDDLEDEAVPGSQVPMTPFTRQDFEMRGVRSAAPTPDTAHPGRKFKPWAQDGSDIAEEDESEVSIGSDHGGREEDGEDEEEDGGVGSSSAPGPTVGGSEEKPPSDFQKWFWENRGNLNRSWKKRRKTAGKEKRYRENKARLSRAI